MSRRFSIFSFIFPLLCLLVITSEAEQKGRVIRNSFMTQLPEETDYLLGKFKASRHPDFRKVRPEYSDGPSHYLLKSVASAFEKMSEAAKKEKVKLRIVSGFRSFDYQKMIWEEKFNGFREVDNQNLNHLFLNEPEKKVNLILKYSAAPGTSRHHWGTDLDINSVDPQYFETPEGKKTYDWLVINAVHFGFFQPYTPERKTGYREEKWHWSYFPESRLVLEKFKLKISLSQISGFKGDSYLPSHFFEDYVLGIANAPQ